jgi:hypothetical protein
MAIIEQQLQTVFEWIADSVKRPALFETDSVSFWDDPYISEHLLAAHLNPESDGASRTLATIEETVANLTKSALLKPGDRVLDLGCGPGLERKQGQGCCFQNETSSLSRVFEDEESGKSTQHQAERHKAASLVRYSVTST